MADKKSRILYIQRYLERETDEGHPATLADILAYLEAEGIAASRQTIAREIEQLIESGADIIPGNKRPVEYFVGTRCFELPELKLLVDAVQASRFISARKAAALIGKLSGFPSRHQAGELQRSLYTARLPRTATEQAYITVDLLHAAVSAEKKITFKYFDWSADKKKVYKHGRRDYRFSPYGLVWNSDRYYTVGFSDNHGKVITLRVDRIAAPKLLPEPAAPRPEGFDMAFYAENAIQMYDGPLRDVTLVCENDMMKHIIDRFGESVSTEPLGPERFAARVRVPASPTFFAWVFTFGGGVKIDAPEDVAADFRAAALRLLGE